MDFLKDTITGAFARHQYDIPAILDYGCKIGYLGVINSIRGFTLKTNGKIKEGDIVYNPLLRKLQTPSTDMIELNPGECKTVFIETPSFGNASVLTYYKFYTHTTSDMRLYVTEYFTKI